MFRGDEPRKDLNPAFLDQIVVVAASKLHAPVLDDAESATLGAVLGIQLLEQQDAVRDALHLQIAIDRGQVVEQQHGALPGRKKLFQRENLPPITERTSGKQPQFRERIEDHTGRFQSFDILENQLRDRRQLDFRRVKHGVLLVEVELLFPGGELPNLDAIEHPAVRFGARAKLLFRLRKRDVQHRLAAARAVHRVLQRQRRLA